MVGAGGAAATGQVGAAKTHDFLMKFGHALGDTLTGALVPGSALLALQKRAASDVVNKILPAVQRGKFGETAAGAANAGANEIRQLKAKLADAGAYTPNIGGLFSELERALF